MGIFNSKKPPRETISNLPPNQTQICDDENVNRLRKDLNDNPERFLMNNILMSIQFYENFEREMEDLRKNQVSEREMELNKLLGQYQKHCLLPDTVMECINERVRFRPFHGEKKYESEPLLRQRIFIVHDNIEILDIHETSEYSTVDGPIHRAILERSENRGYVQLRQIEFLNVGKNEEMDDDDDVEDNVNDDNESIKTDEVIENIIQDSPKENLPKEKSVSFGSVQSSPPPTPEKQRLFIKSQIAKENHFIFSENLQNEKRSSLKDKIFRNHSFTLTSSPKLSPKVNEVNNVDTSKEIESQSQTNNEDYGYTTLRRMTASKPLHEVRAHRTDSGITGIPSYCIKEVKIRKIVEDDNDEESNEVNGGNPRKPPKKKEIKDFYEIRKYFNSEKFVAYFADVYETLYPILGFTQKSFKDALIQRAVIYCEGVDRRGNKMTYEIYPSVATNWQSIALEWGFRVRPGILDPVTKKIYQWPTKLMVDKIRFIQACVIPVGYVAKRGKNENHELEWSLSFPAAQRYMTTCMSHSQIRCYLFILALYKTFMEPKGKIGLSPYHILNIIFWECEKNYITWPEDRIGVKMIKILKLLYNHLSKGYLPDYFVRERNLFESLPSQVLRISQSKLHDIIEYPVPHIILAMRNLRYTSGNFFPSLNFKSLYSILTKTNSLALLNPSLANMINFNMEEENKKNNTKNEQTLDPERQWKRNLKKQIDLQNKEKENLKQKERRISVDSIDKQVNIQKLDTYRKRCLLEFFIMHFVDVVTKCIQYQAFNYALIVLEHTHSLAVLLGEEPSGELEAKKWKRKIDELTDQCRHEQQLAMPTVESNRDSRNFAGVRFLDHNLNIDNLQNAYLNINNQDVAPKKKRPANLTISVDVHNADMSSPAKSTPRSIHLEDNDTFNNSTDL